MEIPINKISSYLADKVIKANYNHHPISGLPAIQRRIELSENGFTSCHIDSYDPNSIRLDEVTGGFNSVIQIASSKCKDIFTKNISIAGDEIILDAANLQEFIEEQEEPFNSHYLNEFNAARLVEGIRTSGDTPNRCAIKLSFILSDFVFLTPNRLKVTYRGDIELYQIMQELDPVGLDDRERTRREYPREEPIIPIRKYSSPGVVTGHLRRSFSYQFLHHIGHFDFFLNCEYIDEPSESSARIEVFADLSTSDFDIELPGKDIDRFYERFFSDRMKLIENQFTVKEKIPLTPPISLVGVDPALIEASEFEVFRPCVFHVSPYGETQCQALVIGFDLVHGNHGTPASVIHFIGNHEFGRIGDEASIQFLFMHKWRIGGFYRNIKSYAETKVEIDSAVEDATLVGIANLKTLDSVIIESDPDEENDFIFMTGSGIMSPTEVHLRSGRVLGPSEVDFGSPEDFNWVIKTSLNLDFEFASDPELAQFQLKAHEDAYRYFSRPFTYNSISRIEYTRLNSTSKQAFILGNI